MGARGDPVLRRVDGVHARDDARRNAIADHDRHARSVRRRADAGTHDGT
jgi:hypothetical protein